MPSDGSQRTHGRPRVLLVEDDGITARYVRSCLRSAGYPPPVVATSAEDALALARAEPPDLVLMDIVLRGEMDGVEAAGHIHEHTGAPVVFVTARSDEATRQRAMAMGASSYLVKPFLERELCAAMDSALHRTSPARLQPIARSPDLPDADSAYEELCALAEELKRQNEELTRAQQRVEAERQRYRSLFDLAPDGYLVTDDTGVILEANQGACELLGVEPSHLAGKPLSVFLPYGGHRDYYELLGHLQRDRQRRQWETPLRPRDRDPFRASLTILPTREAEGRLVVLHWMIRDISAQVAAEQALHKARDNLEARIRERTAELVRLNVALQFEMAERRRAEESLRESRQLLQSIADVVPHILYAYDLREQRTIYTSTRAETYLGYPSHALRGLALDAILDLVHPDDRKSAESHLELLRRAADGETIGSTLRLRHHDGDWRWVRFRDVVSARDATGEPTRYVGTAEDVTEQRAAQAALMRAERLADAGRLAASFAHEINNPLQGVLGCLGLLQEALAEGREAGRYLEVAQREVRRAVRMVEQLRALGRQAQTPAERVETDLTEIVLQVLAITEKRCSDQGVQVMWAPPDAVPPVVADPNAIQQVFLNLALNALDAMPDGGSLRISIAATTNPNGVCVTFADSGSGIAPDLVPRLFDSFVTTKAEGLGLGLYISRNIVEQHDGRIEVETSLGIGTTFSVWLPAQV